MKTYMYSNDDGNTWYNEICEAVEDNSDWEEIITLTQAEMVQYEFPKWNLSRLTDYIQESISEYMYDDLGGDAANSAEKVMKKNETELYEFLEGFINKTIISGGIFSVGEEKEITVKLADYE